MLENGPLTGIRVLDLGRHVAGPTAAMFLGDLGADVIKIENPEHGDDGRQSGPPFFTAQGPAEAGISAYFLAANRNKRSFTLDIKRPEGQALFRKLADTADVIIENFRPGVMDALGIGYDKLSATNPGIIFCSISGFGADGPYADRPGLDNIVQGVSGLMGVTGFEGQEPVRVGIPIADLLTGLYGSYGVLAALQARERTGKGQRVETSLLESMVGTMGFQAVRYLNGGGVPPPAGNHHPINAPYGAFRTGDGYITIGGTGEKRWKLMCEVLGADDLLADERFKTNGGRYANRLLLADLISEKLQSKTSDEWEILFNSAGVPCGPIYDVGQAMEHPQVYHREMVVEVNHPVMGKARILGLPVKLSNTPGRVRLTPPMLGADNTSILDELRVPDEERARLEKLGIIRSGEEG